MSERLQGVSELHLSFEDSEILHVKNEIVQVHAAIAFDKFDIERKLDKLNRNQLVGPCQIREPYSIGQGAYLIYAGDMDVVRPIDDPILTGNPSEAVYFCFFQGGGLTIMGQYVKENGVSSHHKHKLRRKHNSREHFFNGNKNLYLWVNDRKVQRVDGEVVIEPLEAHAAFALDKPAFSFIVQESDVFDHDHNGLEKPTIDFLRKQTILAGLYKAA